MSGEPGGTSDTERGNREDCEQTPGDAREAGEDEHAAVHGAVVRLEAQREDREDQRDNAESGREAGTRAERSIARSAEVQKKNDERANHQNGFREKPQQKQLVI